eukprot:2388673-Karenia_brevis.AAC.1
MLPSVQCAKIAFASVIPIVPHDCASGARVHAQRLHIPLVQLIATCSATAYPCGQLPLRPQ